MGVVGSAPENLGEVRNRGVEFTLNWNDRIGKDFEYRVGMNFSFNANKVMKFKGELQKYWTYDAQGNKVSYVNNFSDVSESGFGGYICEGRQLGKPICIRCTEVPVKAIPEVRWISMRDRRTE